MTKFQNICIFSGSRLPHDKSYIECTSKLAEALANAKKHIIYGGGKIGLMGVIAKASLAQNGQVTGIIPEFLNTEKIRFDEISEVIVTKTMAERIKIMTQKADAFIALPGGIGTLEEIMQILTLTQLQQQNKPIILLNQKNFWKPLITLLDHFETEGFLYPHTKKLIQITENVEETLALLI